MTPLKSSAIQSSDYDTASKRLSITFSSGKTYYYDGVSPETAQELNRAESAGRYFQTVIRPHYAGIPAEPEE